jgi:anti-sigma-K factor RskA
MYGTMSDERDTLEDASALAAEYVLGLLDGAELDRARRLEGSDPAFATEIARWNGRLASLHGEVDEVAPPARLWNRIDRSIRRDRPVNDNIAALRRTIAVWRSAAAAMTAVAAVLASVLLLQPQTTVAPQPAAPRSAAPPMVALVGDDNAAKVVVSWDPSARQLILAVAGDLPRDSRHSHELWVIPSGGKPRSLGTIPAAKQSHRQLADALARLLQQGATIAISIEPPGGSPTGAPTGPVVASGALAPA